jgi:hypothetical protein
VAIGADIGVDAGLFEDLRDRLARKAPVGGGLVDKDEAKAVLAAGQAFGEEAADSLRGAVFGKEWEGRRAEEGRQVDRALEGQGVASDETEENSRTHAEAFIA